MTSEVYLVKEVDLEGKAHVLGVFSHMDIAIREKRLYEGSLEELDLNDGIVFVTGPYKVNGPINA